MLITVKKPFAEVKESLAPYKKIGIFGCANCCAVCQTGGSEQIKEMAEKLSDKDVVFSLSCEAPCDQRIARRDLRRVSKFMEEVEALLMLTCGIGVQSVSKVTDTVLIPGVNTVFPGSVARIGEYYEVCDTCGDCILAETGGICPLTLCPKGLANGPCEDSQDGKCEVWDFERDCVWQTIYDKLQQRGRLEDVAKVRDARDWSSQKKPREVMSKR